MAEGNVEKVIADNEQGLLNQVTDLSFLDSVRPLYLNKHFEPVLVCCGFFLTVR